MFRKPMAVLTANYLRRMGLLQSVHIGTGYKHTCGDANIVSDNKKDIKQMEESKGNKGLDSVQSRPIHPGKVRLGFLPDEWFTFFYSKTGVTGPYGFGLGLLNYVFSKEIYVCDHEFYCGLSVAIMCIVAVKKLGPMAASYCDKEIDKVEKKWKSMHGAELQHYQRLIDHELKEQWRAEGSLMLMQVKKENIALQLEAAYREALANVYQDIKNQLDYQVACRNVEVRVNHKHMVTWVINHMEKAMPQSDEETRKKQRADLSAMALRIK